MCVCVSVVCQLSLQLISTGDAVAVAAADFYLLLLLLLLVFLIFSSYVFFYFIISCLHCLLIRFAFIILFTARKKILVDVGNLRKLRKRARFVD